MTDQHDGPALLPYLIDLLQTFLLKLSVSYSQHFVDQDNVRLKVYRSREGQADIHTAGIEFNRGIEEFFNTGKINDFVELAINLYPLHAHQRAIEVNVFSTSKFGMKTHANFQQGTESPTYF